jgi:hypothetical protein
MSVMTPMEFSRAEHNADNSTIFRRNSRNLRYRSSGIRVESCGRAKPLRGECTVYSAFYSHKLQITNYKCLLITYAFLQSISNEITINYAIDYA